MLLLVACSAPVPVKADHSLFWRNTDLSFGKMLNTVAPDGKGGPFLNTWFRRFDGRPLPAQYVESLGNDPSAWDLEALRFKVTGIHNRIDLASPGVHCGELRVSMASEDPALQPFHVLFVFRQPAKAGDCTAVAQKWADLSSLEGEALTSSLRVALAEGLTRDRFVVAETLELTLGPWEWRQWTPQLQNPPLFQQLDVETLNAGGPLRTEFLAWAQENAAALKARTLLVPERFRAPSVRVSPSSRTPLALDGPLRQNLEIVGCAGCHTADADFIQTRTDGTLSPFYEKELHAREKLLERLARGEKVVAPFGPLQENAVLPQ